MGRYGFAIYIYFEILTCTFLCCNSYGKDFITGPNVCWKKTKEQNIQYCCSTYYYDNGQCKECDPGRISIDGIECITCPANTYGVKCKYKCNCSLTQKCDRMIGCIDISSTVMIKSSTEENDYNHNLNATFSGIIQNESTTAVYLSTKREEREQKDTEGTLKHTDTNTSFIVYLLVAGGLVGWLFFCYAAVRFICKNIVQVRPSRQQISTRIEENAVEMSPPIIYNESIYEEIEEGPDFLNLLGGHSQSQFCVKEDIENNSDCENSVSSQRNEDLEHNVSSTDNINDSF